jgi:hypothetical protein
MDHRVGSWHYGDLVVGVRPDEGWVRMTLRPGMHVTNVAGYVHGDALTRPTHGQVRVIIKNNTAHPNVVVNEFVASRMAMLMAVPVPLGDVFVNDTDQQYWCLAAIRHGNFEIPPPDEQALKNIPGALRARMIVFDARVLNEDRHENNIICTPGGAETIGHRRAGEGHPGRSLELRPRCCGS